MVSDLDEAARHADEDLGTEVDQAEVDRSPKRRARSALAMMLRGADDHEIAEALHFTSPSAARVAWETAMASTIDKDTDIRSARQVARLQLREAMKSLSKRALNEYLLEVDPKTGEKRKVRNEEHVAYSQLFLRYIDRDIKLQGLDAPQVISLITPDAVELENLITTLIRTAGLDPAPEGDIFDAEIVDEEEDDGGQAQLA